MVLGSWRLCWLMVVVFSRKNKTCGAQCFSLEKPQASIPAVPVPTSAGLPIYGKNLYIVNIPI